MYIDANLFSIQHFLIFIGCLTLLSQASNGVPIFE